MFHDRDLHWSGRSKGGAVNACPPPPSGQKFFIFMQFLAKIYKIIGSYPLPPGVGAPSSGKSCIRHCIKYVPCFIHHREVLTSTRLLTKTDFLHKAKDVSPKTQLRKRKRPLFDLFPFHGLIRSNEVNRIILIIYYLYQGLARSVCQNLNQPVRTISRSNQHIIANKSTHLKNPSIIFS